MVWNAIIDPPVPGGSAQAAHRHCTRPFPGESGLATRDYIGSTHIIRVTSVLKMAARGLTWTGEEMVALLDVWSDAAVQWNGTA